MGCNDSSSDCDDSFVDLYSTQKVKSTYNSVLERLKTFKQSSVVKDVEEVIENETLRNDKLDTPQLKPFENSLSTDDDYEPEVIYLPVSERRCVRRSARNRNNRVNYNENLAFARPSQPKRRSAKFQKPKKRKDDEVVEIIDESGDEQNVSVNDEINYEVSVKVIWKSVNVKAFPMRRFQKMREIFEHFMKEENVPMEKILFTLKNVKISPNDTPESLNLKVCDFIEGGVLSESVNVTSNFGNELSVNDENCVTVKVQDEQKQIFRFNIKKCEPLKLVMIMYAEQVELNLDNIKFYFDGEILSQNETPESLGMTSDDIIDVKIKKLNH